MDPQQVAPLAPTSPLLAWAAEQPSWVKHIVRDVLDGATTSDNRRVDHYRELCLREARLLEGEVAAGPELVEPVIAAPVAADPLILETLEILRGVNALRDGTAISFAPGLTVIYGENGTGKSGFVRVMKRAAGARTNGPVLGNVRQGATTTPSAVFTTTVGAIRSVVNWDNQLALAPLTRVSVFDTPSSRVHIDDDLTYTYVPEALSHYRVIRDVLEDVKNGLTRQAGQTNQDGARFQQLFRVGTPVYRLAAPITATTSIESLEDLCQLSEQELQRRRDVDSQLEQLKASDFAAQIRLLETKDHRSDEVIQCLTVAASFNVQNYNDTIKALVDAREAENGETVRAFEGDAIPAVFGYQWNTFIAAAVAYEEEAAQHGHNRETTCSLCRQPLGEAAIALLKKYRDWARGEARGLRMALDAQLGDLSREIVATRASEATQSVLQEIGDAPDHEWRLFERGCTRLTEIQSAVSQAMPTESHDFQPPLVAAQAAKLVIAEQLTALRAGQASRTADITRLQAEGDALGDRITLAAHLPEIRAMVQNLKWVAKVNDVTRNVITSQRQLTEASTDHSSRLVNSDFATNFESECDQLNVREGVNLEFPGREARSKRKKVVAGTIRPSDVLSEGEQKAVALADFLAESVIARETGPLVFDDPVNSMDYRRLELVATRFQTLAASRQVIVFSHNVWFVSALLDLDHNRTLKQRTAYWDVTKDQTGSGIVTPGSHPKIDSYRSLRGRLNDTIAQAKRVTGAPQLELVRKGYGIIRSLTEVVAEQDLLGGVTQRYQAHVMMTQLPELDTDNLRQAIDDLYPVYERACRFMDGHSQPTEQANIQPTLADLEGDLGAVQSVHGRFAD